MGEFTIYKENDGGNTVISNCFIDYYLADANDAQIKVYLYLIRMLTSNQITSISDIADKFNHTEKDVCRALRFWETKGLLSLDYDQQGSIKGIHLIPPKVQKKESDHGFVPFVTVVPAMDTSSSTKPAFEKPHYSLDDLKEFKSREKTEEIICIAEQYLKKTLSSNDLLSIFFITDTLQFSVDLIDHLLQYCVEKGKRDFRYIEKVAVKWAEEGVTTVADATNVSAKYNKDVYTIMNALGKTASPTPKEVEYINRWINEFHFSLDIILEACERTVLATDKHRLEYANKILTSWHSANVRTKSDIAANDSSFHSTKAAQSTQKKTSGNNFTEFAHNDYNFSEIEERLLSKK